VKSTAMSPHDIQNDMAYWWPKLAESGVPAPETRLVTSKGCLIDLLDGKNPEGWRQFLSDLHDAAEAVGGYPIFLRTGHFSGKHRWKDTCYVESQQQLSQHVFNLVEESCIADIIGLPTKNWAVRRLIHPAKNHEHRTRMGRPLVPERRCFFWNGETICHHPYWPPDSMDTPENASVIVQLNDWTESSDSILEQLTEKVAQHFEGYWSLDWLYNQGTWYAIDMALGNDSWHWPGCRARSLSQIAARCSRCGRKTVCSWSRDPVISEVHPEDPPSPWGHWCEYCLEERYGEI